MDFQKVCTKHNALQKLDSDWRKRHEIWNIWTDYGGFAGSYYTVWGRQLAVEAVEEVQEQIKKRQTF